MVAMAVPRNPTEEVLNRLMKRCVECPPDQPSCPDCADDETCSLLPQSCGACASTACVKIASIPGQAQATKSSTPIGPIIGGVVAGVIAIVLITYLVWRFCLRGRRQRSTWEPPEKTTVTRSGTVRSTTNSIASTVLTRASNVIQIAYIPGVTVRSTPETPEIPPPMPSIPSSYANTPTNTSPDIEQHFFMPSRDSTWSQATSIATENRISLTPSLARASVATTIYGRDDIVVPPVPAQYAYPTQANVVSVRSGSSTPSTTRGSQTPPVPQVPKTQQLQAINGSQIVARNVTARPVEIKKTGIPSSTVPTLANLAKRSSPNTRKITVPTFSDEKEVVMSPATVIEDHPSSPLTPRPEYTSAGNSSTSGISALLPADGPLGSNSTPAYHPAEPADDISAMIQNAIKNATSSTAYSNQRPEMHKQDSGPFSDANEIKENIKP